MGKSEFDKEYRFVEGLYIMQKLRSTSLRSVDSETMDKLPN